MSIHTGYRVVSFNPSTGMATTLQEQHAVNLELGSYINFNKLFLGNDRDFTKYYLDTTDHPDLILTYSYHDRDVVSGSPSDNSSEVVVNNAYLIDVEFADPELGKKYQVLLDQELRSIQKPLGKKVKVMHKVDSENNLFKHVASVVVTPEDSSKESIQDALDFAFHSTNNRNGSWSKKQFFLFNDKVSVNPDFNPFVTVESELKKDPFNDGYLGLRSTDQDDVLHFDGKNYQLGVDGFKEIGSIRTVDRKTGLENRVEM